MSGRSAARAACAAVLVGLLGACAAPASEGAAEGGEETGDDLLPAPVDARYLTHLLFVAADGRAFFASFGQTVEGEFLARDYRVEMTDGGPWRPLAEARDTLPVARAAWRLLPAPGMSVRVGDAGQIMSLHFPGSGEGSGEGAGEAADDGSGAPAPVRLVAGEEVSVWTGPTGQRESLGVAILEAGQASPPGILFFRRAARALRIPSAGADGETFLFADSLGNGFLIHAGDRRQPAVAHTWLHGIEAAWGDVLLAPPGATAGAARRFEIVGTELWGTFRPLPVEAPGIAAATRLEAILHIGGEAFHFTGLSATLPAP